MASTVTYQYPVSATTVAPTTTQAALTSLLTATVQYGDTDTTATITHNWGLTATQNTALMPVVGIQLTSAPTTAIPVTQGVLGTNTVTILKASATGSAVTVQVTLMRPHSIIATTPPL